MTYNKDNLKEVEKDVIRAKNELCNLLPKNLKQDFIRKSFVAGGCFYSLSNGETPKDYDFFLTNKQFAIKIRKFFEKNSSLKYKQGVKIGKYKGLNLIITANAISIGNYQIITRWVGSPEEVVCQFDFKHLMFFLHTDYIETLSAWSYLEDDRLYYNELRARDIVGTIFRTNKFVSRGFKINHREMSKILLKLNEIGFSDAEIETLTFNDERNNFGS